MRLGFVRCLLLTCCVPVLVGIAERKRRPRRRKRACRVSEDLVRFNLIPLLLNLLAIVIRTANFFKIAVMIIGTLVIALAVTKKLNFTKLKEDLFLSWSCITVGWSSYWMKNNCSKSWPNNEIASLCIDPPSCLNSSTYMDFLPVLGAAMITGLTETAIAPNVTIKINSSFGCLMYL